MDVKEIKTDYPEIADQLKTEGLQGATAAQIAEAHPEVVETLREEGVKTERNRTCAILDAKADPEVAEKAIRDGVSADGAYKLFYEHERVKKESGIQEIEKEAPESAGQEALDLDEEAKQTEGEDAGKTADQIASERARKLAGKENISLDEAQQRVFKEDPDLAKRWQEEMAG